ncbi:MAG TPA: cyclic nucleotide-binding domain-containing protein, partial [Verrucomicrobiae bacterium]|nr:cyclic nucleotide-binding domain-containing protein [Verrucomicrobiae bacterium]
AGLVCPFFIMRIDANTLAAQPFLKDLPAPYLELLAQQSMPSEFKAGEFILQEGSPANRFYLIQEGRVAIEAELENGGTVPVQTLGRGDALGWSWLFPPYYWRFDARAVTPTKAIFFYGTRLRELCEENHDFGYELMKRISDILIRRLQAERQQMIQHGQNLLFPI